jgi:hypothetical protein
MKVKGDARDAQVVAAANLAAQSGSAFALAESFKTALQRSRGREESSREAPRQRSAGRLPATAATRGAEDDRAPTPGAEAQATDAMSSEMPGQGARLRFLLTAAGSDKPKPTAMTESHDAFRLRRGSGSARSCIEVVHSKTGTRFVLSREGDVWLLAVESGSVPRPTELASMIASLQAQFVARGLGAVDIIIG